MAIAIVGGGLTGCLTALELAEAGKRVVLFEKEPQLLSRASTANEGKVHLGFVYAADTSFQTARRMIDDALVFRPVLERWITSREFDDGLYDTFDYVVPRTSMLGVTDIRAHFKAVSDYLADREHATGLTYLGQGNAHNFCEIPAAQPGLQAAFHTSERGVWPALIARPVAKVVKAHPLIELREGARVVALTGEAGAWSVRQELHDTEDGPFDVVVNCAWAERRALDARSGFRDGTPWFYRYKFGVVLAQASKAFDGAPPKNSTALLGSYGDSVYHPGQDALYCSWYPRGMCASALDLTRDTRPDPGDLKSAIQDTWRGYASIDPTYETILAKADWTKAHLIGDFIAARARTDIDDPESRLHERTGHGPVELAPGYWSVETAKYTSSPRCADECARGILERL